MCLSRWKKNKKILYHVAMLHSRTLILKTGFDAMMWSDFWCKHRNKLDDYKSLMLALNWGTLSTPELSSWFWMEEYHLPYFATCNWMQQKQTCLQHYRKLQCVGCLQIWNNYQEIRGGWVAYSNRKPTVKKTFKNI